MGILGNYLPNWLPEDPNQNAAARQGLLAFGAGLLGGRGDLGGILGDGLMAGTQSYQGALAQQQQTALRQAQLDQTKLENTKLQAAADKPMQLQRILTGGAPGQPNRLAGLPKIGDPPRAAASAPAAEPAQAPASTSSTPAGMYETLMDYGNRLSQAGYAAEAVQYFERAEKLRPELKEQVTRTVNGKRVTVNLFRDGSDEVVDRYAPDAEKLNFQNTGGATVGLNPFTGEQVSTITNSVAPGERLAAETTRRGQDKQDFRAREANEINKQGQRSQIINDPTQGPIVVDKGTGQARQVTLGGKAVPGEAVTKREASAKNLIPLIKQADKLIDGATGSYLGAGADQGARILGVATSGAQNIAQLRVLEGNIMMAQPRMEGPQSNMDVELYRQMAAQVGDPTVPTSTKRAALSTLKSLYAKYDQDAPAPAGSGKPQIKSLKDLPKKAGIPAGWTVKEK